MQSLDKHLQMHTLNECKFYILKQQLNFFYVPQKKEILQIWKIEKLFWATF